MAKSGATGPGSLAPARLAVPVLTRSIENFDGGIAAR
jgi:hypothetical protein